MTKITIEATGWLVEFTDAVAADDPVRAITVLEARATAHAGTPRSGEKTLAAKEIVRSLGGQSDNLARWARQLAGQQGATAKELGAVLLTESYPQHKEEAFALLQRLADDENWEVREWAGSAMGELLNRHFEEVHPALRGWLRHSSQFVRRAVAIAVRGATNSRQPERCDTLFELIEPLVTDRAEEVRRNTGPFAVGKMLHHYPEETLARVRKWAAQEDEMSRWNAAMVFVAAPARKHIGAALEVLSDLARDDRRLVWMAVASALGHLVKRDPERVLPELQRWLADDRKLPAALALKRVAQ